jgi:hypothetical protein
MKMKQQFHWKESGLSPQRREVSFFSKVIFDSNILLFLTSNLIELCPQELILSPPSLV